MPPESGEFELLETSISIDGSDEMTFVNFTNLSISQQLVDTCSFSFVWHTDIQNATFSTHVDFYRNNLGKDVTITVGDQFTFKGFITSINCINQAEPEMAANYQIIGAGLFAKLDESEDCNSFYHKTLTDIFNGLNNGQGTELRLSPTNTSQLFYHVQYNTTTFAFYKMLATRYGEWMFYDGERLVVEAPSDEPVELQNGTDIQNIQINAAIRKAIVPGIGYDQYSGEILQNTPSASSTSGMTDASLSGADAAFASTHRGRRIATAPTADILRSINTLLQQAAAASTVLLEGRSRNPLVKIGKKIRITDHEGNSEGEYIIIRIHHSITTINHYENYFSAIPADAQVPPYTNPLVYPICSAQQATVVDNVDADGLDRIKVRFPWMQDSETTPWMSVMVPYAGNGRGMRFIPEIDEEVMVDFVDNNAERPIMIGSFYTTANPSGVAHEGNHIKVFGSRSGRRLEINDDAGTIRISDHDGNTPGNKLLQKSKDQDILTALFSGSDNQDFSTLHLKNTESILLTMMVGGEEVHTIQFLTDERKLIIKSKENIEISSEKNISIAAQQDVTISGTKVSITGNNEVAIDGTQIKAEADATLELKGLSAKFEGGVDATLKGGAMTTVQGAIVKIN